MEIVVSAAKELLNISFLLSVMAKREEIEKMAEGQENIQLFPLQSPELAEHIYSMAGSTLFH